VEVALDPATRLVAGLDDPGARGRQLLVCFGIGDRLRGELGAAIADCRLMLRSSGVRSSALSIAASERLGRPVTMASLVAVKRSMCERRPTGGAGSSGGEYPEINWIWSESSSRNKPAVSARISSPTSRETASKTSR
jgi:hypothetical protein